MIMISRDKIIFGTCCPRRQTAPWAGKTFTLALLTLFSPSILSPPAEFDGSSKLAILAYKRKLKLALRRYTAEKIGD